jgi:hypothetical protein
MITDDMRRELLGTLTGRIRLAVLDRVEQDPVLRSLMPPGERLALMATPAGRMHLARLDAEAIAAADNWPARLAVLRGHAHEDGVETITAREVLEYLGARPSRGQFVRLNHAMTESGWIACRLDGRHLEGSSATRRCRGYRRLTP